ncbi:hypothetical protein Pint_10049 [Pistacia integerrima]|uniref:Uncharacterized protein n=1 Tax=Pistacia integerrima TaxID=434235 RepID=A0ACC0XJD7_9ROSI|nr:hypothetical protein Pint_10049 [Pistacia integerrima]
MENIIHVDEKWFYMTKQSEKYYLLADEDKPLRTCKSKTLINKVMFRAAVIRPRSYEEQPAKKKPKKRKSMDHGLEGLLNRLSESNVESSP